MAFGDETNDPLEKSVNSRILSYERNAWNIGEDSKLAVFSQDSILNSVIVGLLLDTFPLSQVDRYIDL